MELIKQLGELAQSGGEAVSRLIGKVEEMRDRMTGAFAEAGGKVLDFKNNTVQRFTAIVTGASKFSGIAGFAIQAAQGIGSMMQKSMETSSEIERLSTQTGLSRERLQELQYMCGKVGVSFDSVKNAADYLEQGISGSSKAAKQKQDALNQLGVSLTDGEGRMRAMGEVADEAILQLSGMEDVQARNTLAMQLFGKGAGELTPLLEQGQAGLEGLAERAHTLGLVMGEEALDANARFSGSLTDIREQAVGLKERFSESFADIKESVGALGNRFGSALMPVLQVFLDFAMEQMPKIQGVMDRVFTFIQNCVQYLSDLWDEHCEKVLSLVMERFEQVRAYLTMLVDGIIGIIDGALGMLRQFWEDHVQRVLETVSEYFDRLWEKIGSVLDVVVEFIGETVERLLAYWEEHAEQFMAVVIEAFEAVWGVVESVLEAVMEFIDGVLQYLAELWDEHGETFIQTVLDIYNKIYGFIEEILREVISFIRDMLGVVLQFWEENGEQILETVKGAMKWVFEAIKFYWDYILALFEVFMPTILSWVRIGFDLIKGVIQGALDIIMGLVKIFMGVFTGDWRKVWEGVAQVFEGIWTGIVAGLKASINLILTGLNMMVRGMNKIRFSIPDWVPVMGGKSWGFSLSEVPLLANGGVIQRTGLAIVGEAGPELLELPAGAGVRPLDDGAMQGIDYDEMAKAMAKALVADNGGNGGQEVHLHFDNFIGDSQSLKKLERMLQEVRIGEQQRMGVVY